MKIALDTRPMKIKGNGIGVYTRNIYDRLKNKTDNEYTFIDGPIDITHSLKDKIKFYWWNQIKLPFNLKNKGIDIFHATKELEIPFFKPCKYITTIHDTIPYIFREQYFSSKLRWFLFYRLKLWIAVKNSDIIITDSIYSKNDIIKYFKVDPKIVKVVYLSADDKFKICEKSEVLMVKEKFGIAPNDKYVLGIGGSEFRKNVVTLINSFKEFKKTDSQNIKLVIIGKQWKDSEFYGKDDDIIYTGFVEDNELVALYNGAHVFVYPSLYEGFGLPPLEAMACGTPVITSNTTSLPEIVGDAALLVNPESTIDISDALTKIFKEDSFRSSLIEKGFSRLKLYSLDRTVSEVQEIYKEVLK